MGWTSEPVPATTVQTAPAVEKTAPAAPAAPQKKTAAVKTTVKLPAVILANKDLSYKISPVTGSVDAITLADYKNAAQTGPVVLEKISPNAKGAFALSGAMSWELENILTSRKTGNKYVLSRRIKDATGQIFIITQTWELAEKGYAAKYTVNFANPGKNAVNIADTVLCGGELPPWGIVSGDHCLSPCPFI